MKRLPNGLTLKNRLEFYSIPEPNSGCWIWYGSYTRHGYGGIKVAGKMIRTHRAAWQAFRGTIPDGLSVLHKCDNTACINPDHLFLGTQLDNVKDMIAKGRARKRGLKGEENPRAKLSIEQVNIIRLSDKSESTLARQFNVSRSNINAIRRGITWA